MDRLLTRFLETQGEAHLRLSESIRNGHMDIAGLDAHTLKGVSGNIGAGRVQQQATSLETAVKAGVSGPMLEQQLEGLAASLKEAILTIKAHLEARPPAAPTEHSLQTDAALVGPLLERLEGLLAEDDGEAADSLDKMCAVLSAALGAEEFRRIESAVRQFEYARALELIREARDRLGMHV